MMLDQKEISRNRQLFSETDAKMAAAFKALSDINRYRIFRILAQQPKLTVSNIAKILDISLPLTSQHLKVLAHADLLEKERTGKKVFTRLERSNPFVETIAKTIEETLAKIK